MTPWIVVHGILQARILEWIAFLFSRGSFQLRDWTQVSHIACRFFISWATREAQEYWNGYPIPSLVDLLNSGIEMGSPALQVDSLPTELSGSELKSFSPVRLFATPWTVANQSPPSMEFSRQEHWSGLPFPWVNWVLNQAQKVFNSKWVSHSKLLCEFLDIPLS